MAPNPHPHPGGFISVQSNVIKLINPRTQRFMSEKDFPFKEPALQDPFSP